MKKLIKKSSLMLLGGLASLSLVACSSGEDEMVLNGIADGYGGEVTAEVTMEGDKITKIIVTGDKETPEIGGPALEEIPVSIVEANSTDVDVLSGATVTSEAIMYAVNNAIDPDTYPAPVKEEVEEKEAVDVSTADVFQGLGIHNMGRIGPGQDDTDTGVYSINQVFANVLFDGDGKILDIFVDQLEYATPNYDGEGMPQFVGFPGQSYNNDEDHDGVVDGELEVTDESFLEDIEGWVTKRERGDDYRMGTGAWAEQMDTFQEAFVGKTVAEVEEWFNTYTSDLNGRPLQEGAEETEDQEKYDTLSDDEKEMLADVVSGATMSLNDSHGDIIGAIKNAFENRIALDINAASATGFGMNNMGRVGPGQDDTDTGVYSVNQVFANTLFDEAGKIVAIHIDQLEYATPNYDGEGMPQLIGFPGQSYNNDEDHDGVVDEETEATEETFVKDIEGWVTKRERGDSYRMGTGTWAEQMDAFQNIFIGMTVDEVEEWFNNYTSDVNGRPLQEGSEEADDQEKYAALSDEEKEMLTDVVSSATMSLNDSHGDIIAAIKASFANKIDINLTVE